VRAVSPLQSCDKTHNTCEVVLTGQSNHSGIPTTALTVIGARSAVQSGDKTPELVETVDSNGSGIPATALRDNGFWLPLGWGGEFAFAHFFQSFKCGLGHGKSFFVGSIHSVIDETADPVVCTDFWVFTNATGSVDVDDSSPKNGENVLIVLARNKKANKEVADILIVIGIFSVLYCWYMLIVMLMEAVWLLCCRMVDQTGYSEWPGL